MAKSRLCCKLLIYMPKYRPCVYELSNSGQRSRKALYNSSEQTVIVYHYGLEGELLTETDATGKTIRDYVWVNGQGAVQIEASPVIEELAYLYPGHLMTSRLATDSIGTIVWSWEGDAFGSTETDSGPMECLLAFPPTFLLIILGVYSKIEIEIGSVVASASAGSDALSFDFSASKPPKGRMSAVSSSGVAGSYSYAYLTTGLTTSLMDSFVDNSADIPRGDVSCP